MEKETAEGKSTRGGVRVRVPASGGVARALALGAVLAGVLIVAACGGDAPPDGVRVGVETRGDTTVVTSSGRAPLVRALPATILLKDPALEAPRSLLKVAERLVVADRRRIHFVDPETGAFRSEGTAGEGPGEFGSVGALGFAGEDRVAVHDPRRQRVLFFHPDDGFLEEPLTPITPPLVNPIATREPEHFLVADGAAYWIRTGNVRIDMPLPAGLQRHVLGQERAQVLEEWDDRTFIALPSGLLSSRELFPPTTRAAFSRDGRLAFGLGNEPCITVRRVADPPPDAAPIAEAGRGPIRICRDRPPVPAGPSLRSPDLSRIDDEAARQGLEEAVRAMDRPEYLPHYTSLLFAENGDLWVRTPGPEDADAHPFLLGRVPELAPDIQRWEVFDVRGELVQEVELPYRFRPWVVDDDRIYGIAELDSGELALAVAGLPPASAQRE